MEKTIARLALFGGPKSIRSDPGDMFKWPIITEEDEQAVLSVLRAGAMSEINVTKEFEKEFAAWQGRKYALGCNNGTSALHCAMFGCKIGVGDEIIVPSVTYWASAAPVFSLGGTVVFAEIDPNTLCIDPADIEKRISRRTKAIVVVHYLGHPADMDAIMKIARKHKLMVIEDVSHAQGGMYKGRKLGTFGDVAAMSLMSGKSFAIGEGGILVTDDLEIYERAIAFGHYERFNQEIQTEDLQPFTGQPMGGYKYRMHQLSSAVGRVQLKYYDARIAEIRRAFNYFWDLLEGTPGLQAHRVDESGGSNMGGWYAAHGIYKSEELGGLSITRFVQAVRAEGFAEMEIGVNRPLHVHRMYNTCDIYGTDRPTRIANSDRDLRQPLGTLPISEEICRKTYSIPWFKHFYPQQIEEYARAFRKVVDNYLLLLADDPGDSPDLGGWHFTRR